MKKKAILIIISKGRGKTEKEGLAGNLALLLPKPTCYVGRKKVNRPLNRPPRK